MASAFVIAVAARIKDTPDTQVKLYMANNGGRYWTENLHLADISELRIKLINDFYTYQDTLFRDLPDYEIRQNTVAVERLSSTVDRYLLDK